VPSRPRRTYSTVTPTARIHSSGRFPALDANLVGQVGRFKVTLDGKTIVGIDLGATGKAGDIPENAPTLTGILQASDLRKGTLIVRILAEGKDEVRTLETRPSVVTSLVDGRSNNLADLWPGMKLALRTSPDEKVVLWLKATPPIVDVVRRVDVAKRTITLAAGEAHPERTFRVPPGIKMMVNGWPAELQDFRPGRVVSAVDDPAGSALVALWTLVDLGK